MARDLPLVVSSGLCVGCGACAIAEPKHITMRLNELGAYVPTARSGLELSDLDDATLTNASAVCPFSNDATNEDAIGKDLYGEPGVGHHDAIGFHRKIVAGHVALGDFRDKGTSGGMTSWVLAELLKSGRVDGIVHVSSTLTGLPNPMSRYTISRSIETLLEGRKSRYHVQTLEEVMNEVREVPGRYAVVGVPCFIKSIRLLAERDETIRQRITFTASLFCGHLKSTLYTEYLGASLGFEMEHIKDIDYRHKEPGRPPNRYCTKVTTFSEEEVIRGTEQIPMADWGVGLFKLGACDYCDDITGETADISIGDAWLPPFMSDWRGANVAVARSVAAGELLDSGENSKALDVIPWTADQVAASQSGAVRHRRRGLAARLGNRSLRGQWAPRKRVDPMPASELDGPFAQRMLNREAIALASGPAFLRARDRGGDLEGFLDEMKPYIRRYDGSRSSTAWRRAATWLVQRLPPKTETFLRSTARRLGL